MKNLLLIMVILVTVSCQSGTKQKSGSASDAVEITEVTQVTLDIGGMHCNNCVASVEKGINELEGIASVAVSLNDSNAIVEYDARKLKPEDIEKAIEKRGYRIKNN